MRADRRHGRTRGRGRRVFGSGRAATADDGEVIERVRHGQYRIDHVGRVGDRDATGRLYRGGPSASTAVRRIRHGATGAGSGHRRLTSRVPGHSAPLTRPLRQIRARTVVHGTLVVLSRRSGPCKQTNRPVFF